MKTKKAYNTIDNTGGFKDLFNDNTLIFRSQMKTYKNKAQTIKKCRRVYYIYIYIYILYGLSVEHILISHTPVGITLLIVRLTESVVRTR